jgi:hypothetical protein
VFNYPTGGYGKEGHIFVIGKAPLNLAAKRIERFQNIHKVYNRFMRQLVPTDDWPFLYYKEKSLSKEYRGALFLLLVISGIILWMAVPHQRTGTMSALNFFFLGAGFMLLEAKNITWLALDFGSTWVITSLVIVGVLLMVLASIALVETGYAPSDNWTWGLLVASLLLTLAWHEQWVALGPMGKGLATTFVVSLTFLFSSIVFSRLFARTHHPSQALGFNVLGAVVGGIAEYFTLVYGIRMMYALALLFYLAAWGCHRWALTASPNR